MVDRIHRWKSRLVLGLIVFVSLPARAENWAQWRGPRGDGTSIEKNVPVEWSPTKNIAWKTPIPGEGHSSPMVWQDTIFLTTASKDTGERWLIRLDATTGKIVWKIPVVKAPVESMHRENSPASSSPITDGKLVFTSFQNGTHVDLQCFDYTGKRIWSQKVLQFRGMHGYSYTPLLYRDLLIIDCSQNDESAVLALEKTTAKVRWRYDRKRNEISHVTPLLINDGTEQVVVCGGDEIRSFNPMTGESLWWADGPTEVSVAGIVYGDKTVFVTGGYPDKTRMAVNTTGRGDVTKSGVLWSLKREVSYVPSPVYSAGYLYTMLDDGLLHCFDGKTGKTVWNERVGGRFRSSPVLADGNIYVTNDKGLTIVFRATPAGFQPVAKNDLNEFCYASPAISNGRIYIRTGAHLYCIGQSPLATGSTGTGK